MKQASQSPKRYLITGVAGSGKSTLEKRFRQEGYITVDIDDRYAEWRHATTDEVLSYNPDEPGWHEVAEWVVKLMTSSHSLTLIPVSLYMYLVVSHAWKQVIGLFDTIFLLEYPNEATMRERIAGREGGYGKHPGELARIVSYVQPYQDKMKQHGAITIDCTLPIEQIVRIIKA